MKKKDSQQYDSLLEKIHKLEQENKRLTDESEVTKLNAEIERLNNVIDKQNSKLAQQAEHINDINDFMTILRSSEDESSKMKKLREKLRSITWDYWLYHDVNISHYRELESKYCELIIDKGKLERSNKRLQDDNNNLRTSNVTMQEYCELQNKYLRVKTELDTCKLKHKHAVESIVAKQREICEKCPLSNYGIK